ncbi:MAG: FtsX-like permease family protein [Cyclobacteriaceae bacterium]|jgi:putative ABC transport system permease protein|nr:macrolide export ATP-binding/permease MacB [Cytophagales bacterium]HNP76873.1 ABC transporter permease [Cyclobacteriaceae bacterium]
MIRNYLKTAFRSIFRNKLTAFINIAGLALAIAASLLIYLFVSNEVSYDKQHANADRIYRVTRNFKSPEGVSTLHLSSVAPPIGPLLKNDFGNIEIMARTLNNSVVLSIEENGERSKISQEKELFMVEPDLFRIFDIPVIAGDPTSGLERPFTVMLSESAAKQYFETTDVIGKHLKADQKLDLEVTGIYKDFPIESHWHPRVMMSFSTLNDSTIYGRKNLETNWGNNAFQTYLLLEPGTDAVKLESEFPGFLDRHYGPFAKANYGAPEDFVASKRTTLFLQKVTDIHLRSHLDDEIEVNGNISNVYLMAVIGLFIVLIACFNFVNLSTARATKRAKEVGMRKAVGAHKNQLIFQYLSESVLVAFLGLILALVIATPALDWLNRFTGKALSLLPAGNISLYIGAILFTVMVGILAGLYPAFVISAFNPASVLKGNTGTTRSKGGIRRTLVVMQFFISITLIISTLITIDQLSYLNTRSLGFTKDQVVTLPLYRELSNNYDAFYNELVKSTSIKNVALSSRLPTGRLLDSNGEARVTKGDSLVPSGVTLKMVAIDYEFFNTYEIEMAAGRNFSKNIPTDDSLSFIINETAARKIGWTSPGEGVDKDFLYGGVRGKLIGVVKDFHFESLHQEIAPMIFFIRSGNYNVTSVKLNGAQTQEALAHLERVWKDFLPLRPFDYQFLNDRYQRLYLDEQKQGQLFTVFSGLAIFIACLGLFGLATFNTLQRIKEIGVRKVLGATVPHILMLLSREIIYLILAANVLAWPVAWYFMNQWLGSFAYHIDISVFTFILAGVVAVVIALMTVSAQTWKAAMTNPSNTLRYE